LSPSGSSLHDSFATRVPKIPEKVLIFALDAKLSFVLILDANYCRMSMPAIAERSLFANGHCSHHLVSSLLDKIVV